MNRVAAGDRSEIDERIPVRNAEYLFKLASLAIKGAVACFIAWRIELAIGHLAGGETSVSVIVNWAVGKGALPTLGGLFGAGGIVYGARERKEKKRKTAAMARRIKELEHRLDPNRTSCGLTPEGDTHPDDL